ncbi:hypothetical protein, partial [Bradyrhizobium ottawaense]|uniref:hypothetical protein n=1 Tax=Bradyrhizobium ottawaense TaxID=931866 RepID=UPI0030C6C946
MREGRAQEGRPAFSIPAALKARCDQDESSSRSRSLFKHELFGKLLRTFPEHALSRVQRLREVGNQV